MEGLEHLQGEESFIAGWGEAQCSPGSEGKGGALGDTFELIFGKLSPLHSMIEEILKGALISRDLQESRDSAHEPFMPFKVPCPRQSLFSFSCTAIPSPVEKFLGFGEESQAPLPCHFHHWSLQPFLHPFTPKPLSC